MGNKGNLLSSQNPATLFYNGLSAPKAQFWKEQLRAQKISYNDQIDYPAWKDISMVYALREIVNALSMELQEAMIGSVKPSSGHVEVERLLTSLIPFLSITIE